MGSDGFIFINFVPDTLTKLYSSFPLLFVFVSAFVRINSHIHSFP